MKRPWWKTGFVWLAWIAAFLIVAALGSGFSSGGSVPLWVWILFALGAFNLAYSNITDRLDAIQWELDDLKNRLPDPHEHAFEDFPLETPKEQPVILPAQKNFSWTGFIIVLAGLAAASIYFLGLK